MLIDNSGQLRANIPITEFFALRPPQLLELFFGNFNFVWRFRPPFISGSGLQPFPTTAEFYPPFHGHGLSPPFEGGGGLVARHPCFASLSQISRILLNELNYSACVRRPHALKVRSAFSESAQLEIGRFVGNFNESLAVRLKPQSLSAENEQRKGSHGVSNDFSEPHLWQSHHLENDAFLPRNLLPLGRHFYHLLKVLLRPLFHCSAGQRWRSVKAETTKSKISKMLILSL